MTKGAIVAVSFGVGDIHVKERCLDALLADVRKAFRDFEVREAWTSSFFWLGFTRPKTLQVSQAAWMSS